MDKQPDDMLTSDAVNSEDQNSTYTDDVDFRSNIVAAQSPLSMSTVAAVSGFVPPDFDSGFLYCDLGCGDGTTLNALAELYPNGSFTGIDLNASHIQSARDTAAEFGLSNVKFVETSFSDLDLTLLPEFDFIGMSGIYSWLEANEAQAVRAFLESRLKPGGLLFVDYTSLPGKISIQPFWALIKTLVPEHESQTSAERARKGLDLTAILAKRGMKYLSAHRNAASGVRSYLHRRHQDPYTEDHFAHNALAVGFRPRYFTEIYDEMASVGLQYAGRCELQLNEIELSVNPAQVPTFQDYKHDVRIVETLKDYIRNEQKRNDIFVKSAKPEPETADNWLDRNLYLLGRMLPTNVVRKINTLGNQHVPLRGPAYEAVISAAGQGVVTPLEVANEKGLPLERVRKAAIRLLASNQFFQCRHRIEIGNPDLQMMTGIEIPSPVNRRTLSLVSKRFSQNQLISPHTGGTAVPVSPMEAVMLNAITEAGGFEGAAENARDFLATETRLLPTMTGQKKAMDITVEELGEVLRAMRGRKMVNMIRLGIIKPLMSA